MNEVEGLKRIIEILDQEGVEKCEKLEAQAKQIKMLEKALDKACYMLNGYMAHEWKEYLLKEVQEDE